MRPEIEAAFVEASTSALAPDPRKRIPLRPAVTVPKDLLRASTAAVRQRVPVRPNDGDLTKQCEGPPLGQRILVTGRVLDGAGQPIEHALLEIWQANASGTYRDVTDPLEQPLDPNFLGRQLPIRDREASRVSGARRLRHPLPTGSHPCLRDRAGLQRTRHHTVLLRGRPVVRAGLRRECHEEPERATGAARALRPGADGSWRQGPPPRLPMGHRIDGRPINRGGVVK